VASTPEAGPWVDRHRVPQPVEFVCGVERHCSQRAQRGGVELYVGRLTVACRSTWPWASCHDYERLPETSEAMIKWAMIGLMVRRLEPPPGRKPWHRASTAA